MFHARSIIAAALLAGCSTTTTTTAEQQVSVEAKRVDINGMKMYYEVSGAGEPLKHSVALFKLLGGGVMGDMGTPLPASRLAIIPATSHTAVITQPTLLHSFIAPFLKGEIPKGFFEDTTAEKE